MIRHYLFHSHVGFETAAAGFVVRSMVIVIEVGVGPELSTLGLDYSCSPLKSQAKRFYLDLKS